MKIKDNQSSGSMDTLSVMLLYLIFAMFVIMTFVSSIKAYQSIIEKSNNNFEIRTSLQYISNKVKAYENKGKVEYGEINNIPAIRIMEKIDNREFSTYIYDYKGALMELFVEDGIEVNADAGMKITDLHDFSIKKLDNGYIEIENSRIPLLIKCS